MFAFVGSRTTKQRKARGDGINVYRIDADTGIWRHVHHEGNLINPSFLALAADGQTLYAVHGDLSFISAFAVDSRSGKLRWLNTQGTEGKNPVHVTISPDGKFLIVTNYETGNVVSLPIAEGGALEPVACSLQFSGNPGPHRQQQASSHPHQAQFDPARQFLLVPDKGIDRVFCCRFDENSGALSDDASLAVATREGAGPRHIAFHPGARFAFVANELASSITTYAYDSASGQLRALNMVPSTASEYTGNNTVAGILTSQSGAFVYCSNRGEDTIGVFRFDSREGRLHAVEWVSTLGEGPRFFTLSPDGAWLYAANELGHTVAVFGVDSETGRLTPSGQIIPVGSPMCIVFGPLAKAG